ncbi:hypothetical protein ACPZ19_50095 [Amycolatopsis lurida]
MRPLLPALTVLSSYPPSGGLQLHSLTEISSYTCDSCLEDAESAMVATAVDALICPGCYARLARNPVPLIASP